MKELENEYIKQGHYNIQEIKYLLKIKSRKTVMNLAENKTI